MSEPARAHGRGRRAGWRVLRITRARQAHAYRRRQRRSVFTSTIDISSSVCGPAAARRPSPEHRSRREAAASSGHNPSRRLFQQRKVPTLLEQVRGHGHSISPQRWRCQRSLQYRHAHERFPLDGRSLVAAQHRPQADRPRRPPARRLLSDQRRQKCGAAANGVGTADTAFGDVTQRAGQSRCRRAGGAAAAPGLRHALVDRRFGPHRDDRRPIAYSPSRSMPSWSTRMRASVLLLGALLARCGEAALPMPGRRCHRPARHRLHVAGLAPWAPRSSSRTARSARRRAMACAAPTSCCPSRRSALPRISCWRRLPRRVRRPSATPPGSAEIADLSPPA